MLIFELPPRCPGRRRPAAMGVGVVALVVVVVVVVAVVVVVVVAVVTFMRI